MTKFPRQIIVKFALLAAIALSMRASAQVINNHNSSAPIDFSAGEIEIRMKENRVYLTQGASITQDGLSIKANRMTVAYKSSQNTDVNRLDAIGNVTITKRDLKAFSDNAIYDVETRIITLIGNVLLIQNNDRLGGQRLTIDLTSGRSTLSGGSNSKQKNGRVTGTFTVSNQKREKPQ